MRRLRLKNLPPAEVFGDDLVLDRPEAAVDFAARLGGRPLALELCCGNGHFLAELAVRTPERAFVGVDRQYKRVGAAARKLRKRGLDNVRLVLDDAERTLTLHFGPASLAAVYILFPDPWPKRRHHKHRLVTASLLAAVRERLVPGGEVVVAHDHEEYCAWIAARLRAAPGLVSRLPAPGFSLAPQDDLPRTLYERRWRAAGRPIRYFRYRRE